MSGKLLAIIFFLFTFSLSAFAQSDSITITADTVVKSDPPKAKNDTLAKKKHSPRTATLLSVALPGLGQCYNKKYWKVPIIYGGFAALTYGIIFNGGEFSRFKTAYGYRVDDDPITIDEFDGRVSDAELLSNMDFYRRNRDLCYVGVTLLYVLNIIDAAVDAHLYDFDVSDNLSLNIQPEIRPIGYANQTYAGARLTFVLK